MAALRVQHLPHSIWYTNPSLLNALISITGAHVQGKIVIKAICIYHFHNPHPYTVCRYSTRNSLIFRSGIFQSTWPPGSTAKAAKNSNRAPLPLPARSQ